MNHTNKTLISRTFLCIMSLAFIITATGQTKTINKFYLQGGAGLGTHESGSYDIGIQAIFKNKWSATLSYQELSMSPKNKPADYQGETGYALFLFYSDLDLFHQIVDLIFGWSNLDFRIEQSSWTN